MDQSLSKDLIFGMRLLFIESFKTIFEISSKLQRVQNHISNTYMCIRVDRFSIFIFFNWADLLKYVQDTISSYNKLYCKQIISSACALRNKSYVILRAAPYMMVPIMYGAALSIT